MPLPLAKTLELLEELAPLRYAESWDNVGLIIDPNASPTVSVGRILLTIDLSEAVLAEAVERRVNLIVAYHPPLFAGLKRLRHRVPSERVAIQAINAGLPVYSPHTALDATPGGVNDWLAAALGPGECEPLAPSEEPNIGMGRKVTLAEPVGLEQATQRVKDHLGLTYVRVAASERHQQGEPIHNGAVCAGAGGSLFSKESGIDLYLTGEMRHHDVRDKTAAGSSVILCDHTNTERGYLPMLAERIVKASGGSIKAILSARDEDPLKVL